MKITMKNIWVGMPLIWTEPDLGIADGEVIGFTSDDCGFHVKWIPFMSMGPTRERMVTYFFDEIPDRLSINLVKIREDKLNQLEI
jgi:hypothetical protein